MIGRQDKFSGNILLYDYLLSKRTPIFLDRNLTRALQFHQYLLEHGSTEGIPGSNHALRSIWKPPSWDKLDDMIGQESSRGSFTLNVHGLKTFTSNHAIKEEPVRKVRNLFNINCTLQLAVYPKGSDRPCKKLQPQKAILKGVESTSGRKVYLETEQMTVQRGDFKVSQSKSGRGFQDAYKMVLSINFDSIQDAVNVYAFLGCKTAEEDIHTRLIASCENILECAQGETVLQLRDQRRRLDFGFNVSMYWSDIKTESVLAAHNQQLRTLFQSDSLPTPPLELDKPRYELTFVYAKETITRSGLSCPHEACKQKRPKDIDDLRMHLLTWHDYFRYQAVQDSVDDDGVEYWRFECDVADHKADQRASARAAEPFDVHVIAPSRPFNRQKYLNDGNEEFQRTARGIEKTTKQSIPTSATISRRRKPPEEVQERPARPKKTYPVPRAPPGVTFFRSQSKRPLKEKEEISESDDEVDTSWIDLLKTAELEKNKVPPESAKRLLQIFDKFMSEESLNSDACAGDALIRFVQNKGQWLWQESLTEEFTCKITELLEDDIVSPEIHSGCLKLLNDRKPEPSQDANILSQHLAALYVQSSSTRPSTPHQESTTSTTTPRRSNKAKGHAKVTETGHITPITADSDGDIDMADTSAKKRSTQQLMPLQEQENTDDDPPYDTCFCGKDAMSINCPAGIIACNSVVSALIRKDICE